MLVKWTIRGDIEVLTGMHIGGSSAFAAIGAVDSPVIKDVKSGYPMIPGSSLKGKIRTLLARQYNTRVASPDEDDPRITRVFGNAKKHKRSRLLVFDMVLANAGELHEKGLQSLTEVKFENSIDRATAVANPRQIERAVRGSVFELDMVYEMEEKAEFLDDIRLISEGMKLLQYDYLGGHGSRGYGKVRFSNLYADVVVGEADENLIDKCNDILRTVEE